MARNGSFKIVYRLCKMLVVGYDFILLTKPGLHLHVQLVNFDMRISDWMQDVSANNIYMTGSFESE